METQNNYGPVIKGIKDGLLITLGEGEWETLQTGLLQTVQEKASFFQGARVVLDVGNHVLHAREMSKLRDQLSEQGIFLTAILSPSEITESTAQILGLGTRISIPKADRAIKSMDTNLDGDSAILVQRNMRSGFRVESKRHVVVIGDVNPGAEILTEGSVVVWGKLHGSVQAGMDGNENVIVCALDLSPTLLRISGYSISLRDRKGRSVPEVASLHEGEIQVSIWENYKLK